MLSNSKAINDRGSLENYVKKQQEIINEGQGANTRSVI